MSQEKFTRSQRELLDECARNYAEIGSGILVKGLTASYSLRTATSLQDRGYLSIRENAGGDKYAYFTSDQNSDWHELSGGLDDQ